MELTASGGLLVVDGVEVVSDPRSVCPAIYALLGDLLQARRSEVDSRPLRMVADAFLSGRRIAG